VAESKYLVKGHVKHCVDKTPEHDAHDLWQGEHFNEELKK
jgi:hypothetical protein